ncbi:MAG: sterol desaturase family protein [Geminicoccaceae bacterium]|nr:sterol desaturase family protein [Geminicoccaceae bacterium]
MLISWGPWSDRSYFLDKMTLADLVRAYFTYYSIQAYILVAIVAIAGSFWLADGWAGPLTAVIVVVLAYPFVEYVVHRYLLHSHELFKHKATAKVWKRIHYDHHQNPHDLAVLFGALYTTLPTIAGITLPIGGLIDGWAGALAAFATGCIIFCVYEFTHCMQHLPFNPRITFLREIKRRHLAHHFHSEHGNFGITQNMFDHVFGTFYAQPKDVPRSDTVHNLGYAGPLRDKYPWVAELSADDETYARRRKRRDV